MKSIQLRTKLLEIGVQLTKYEFSMLHAQYVYPNLFRQKTFVIEPVCVIIKIYDAGLIICCSLL